MKILHVDASITGPASVSRTLSAEIVQSLRRLHPHAKVTVRDLAAKPIGHLSDAHLLAAQGAVPEEPVVLNDIAAGRGALDEFLAADIVVVGAPMYNFAIPSQLKAWIRKTDRKVWPEARRLSLPLLAAAFRPRPSIIRRITCARSSASSGSPT